MSSKALPTFSFNTTAEEVANVFADGIRGKTGDPDHRNLLKGIGFETARVIAKYAKLLIIAGYNEERLKLSEDAIKKETPTANIYRLTVDLSSLASVRKAAAEVNALPDPLHVLINNAAATRTGFTLQLTSDNVELQYATNHVGPWLFTNLLIPKLIASSSSNTTPRVIFLSSDTHYFGNGVDFSLLETPTLPQVKDEFDGFKTYWGTKCTPILTAIELTKRTGGRVAGFSLAPDVSFIYNFITAFDYLTLGTVIFTGALEDPAVAEYLKAGGYLSADGKPVEEKHPWKTLQEGAATTLTAAFDTRLNGAPPSLSLSRLSYVIKLTRNISTNSDKAGAFLSDCNIKDAAAHSTDPATAEKLWAVTEKIVGRSLSSTWRETAESACSGKVSSVGKFLQSLHLETFDGHPSLLLPIVYYNLRLPGDSLDAHTLEGRTIAAQIVLKILTFMENMPKEALMEIWPRYWCWLRKLHPLDDGESPPHCLIALALFLFDISRGVDQPSSSVLARTPGLRVYVGRAWIYFGGRPAEVEESLTSKMRLGIWRFLQYNCMVDGIPSGTEIDELEELTDGAGGVSEFAALIIRHIALFSRGRTEDLKPLEAVFPSYDGLYTVRALAAFQTVAIPPQSPLLKFCFTFIHVILNTRPIHSCIKQALAAGLLPVLMRYSLRRDSQALAQVENDLLSKLLDLISSACIYPSILCPLAVSFEPVIGMMQLRRPEFEASSVYTAWTALWTIHALHHSLWKRVQSSRAPTRMVCDNLEVRYYD
ncbi:hypothetical protein R3P38DRAFT_3190348 [Favolaschia claudopus]|uniref:Uncharacterized protein n=1 Tax=Favolaschia claudopus TaxID=2862362 RepID=A0AAW0BQF9_9AGAR